MDIYIISSNFYDPSNSHFTIGGIQTYIRDLYRAVINSGHNALMVQFGLFSGTKEIESDGFKILLFPYVTKHGRVLEQRSFDRVYKSFNTDRSIFIIDTDQRDIKSDSDNVVQIQHGIAFDIPGNMISGFWGKSSFLQRINKQLRCWRNVARLKHVHRTVCVDYNYFNWFRTLDTITDDYSVRVIPNYAGNYISEERLKEKIETPRPTISILFARRFVDYRGAFLMIEATKALLSKFNHVSITFAGSGPLEQTIKDEFKGENRVVVTRYDSAESLPFHSQFDIAVIPTIFSEGTSLSLCEAMAAGCIPIATCAGGMSNIVINNYNGILIQPCLNDLINAMMYLIELPQAQRSVIAKRAYDTAIVSFSKERWERQWLSFLNIADCEYCSSFSC